MYGVTKTSVYNYVRRLYMKQKNLMLKMRYLLDIGDTITLKV